MDRIKFVSLLTLAFIGAGLQAQPWTAQELIAANTAEFVPCISEEEKNAIKYLNLARMFPKKFAQTELKAYITERQGRGTEFEHEIELRKTLMTMKPVGRLVFNKSLYESAACFTAELATKPTMTCQRTSCPGGAFSKEFVYFSLGQDECKGRDIVLAELCTNDLPSNGRDYYKTLLSPTLVSAGISIHIKPLPQKEYCCVLDFSDGQDPKTAQNNPE
jgi:hypothetical protein